MLSARGHRRNDNPPIPCPLCTRTGPSVLQYRKYQITRREMKPNGYHGDGEHSGNGGGGGNDGGGRNGGGGGNGGGVGGNRGGGGSKYRSRGGGKQNKSSKDSEFGDKTARPDCYFCLGFHIVSECTNLGSGLLVATSARPALATRGAPRERHEDEYLVEDSGATENMTQDSSNLEDCAPPPPGDEVESASGVVLPVGGYGRRRLLVDQDNGTFTGATRELTLDRVVHVPKLGRHNLFSIKRLTTGFDAPMRVYPAAATIRPRFGRKTLAFRSLRPETGLLEMKACRRADMKDR